MRPAIPGNGGQHENENSGAKNPSTMIDSGVDSEASSPDSGPARPDLLLETAETLLALSGKQNSPGIETSSQNPIQKKGKSP